MNANRTKMIGAYLRLFAAMILLAAPALAELTAEQRRLALEPVDSAWRPVAAEGLEANGKE